MDGTVHSTSIPLALHPNSRDLTGQRFGRLTVLELTQKKSGRRELRWLCRCDCGNQRDFAGWRLSGGYVLSCGCLQIEQAIVGSTTHGYSDTRTYKIWGAMRQRCTNPHDSGYHNYGARGISVCKRWQDFENFLLDMGEAPAGMSIDRIDNNGDYTPENCRWATRTEQGNNKRNNVRLEWQGRTQTVPQWARELGMKPTNIRQRLRDGWTVDRALSTPLHNGDLNNERANTLAEQAVRLNDTGALF